jgi:hypothetical protein
VLAGSFHFSFWYVVLSEPRAHLTLFLDPHPKEGDVGARE